ncbi:MAG: hypothetical protein ACREVN_13700 [Gammaproteobacteria bacterium]
MKKQLAIILGMSLATGAAIAGEEGGYTESESMETGTSTAMNFEDLDVNQDSLISEQEATDSGVLDSEAFASADTNQDGYLSQTEFDAQSGTSVEEPTEFESETETDTSLEPSS